MLLDSKNDKKNAQSSMNNNLRKEQLNAGNEAYVRYGQ